MERMCGEDASFIHLERMDEPCHTLKVVVLDTEERGHPVSLDEVRAAIDRYLPLYPRARQRVVFAPSFRGLPFWVDDPDFDLDLHLREQVLPAPGGRRELDAACSTVASARMDLHRPLWDATLLHGLEGGRQAVVFRLHHSVSDGMGVVRLLERVTTPEPGAPEPPPPDTFARSPIPSARELRRAALAGVPRTLSAAGSLLGHDWRHRKAIEAEHKAVRERDDLYANKLAVPYTWLNVRFGTSRLCATGSLPLADFKRVKERAGATLNGVLLAVLGGALRAECEQRGEGLDADIVCGLGMVGDASDSTRMWGNNLTNLFISLHTTEPDPVERLRKVTRSASDTVALRRQVTEGRSAAFPDVAARFGPTMGRMLAYRVDHGLGNLSAGNVPGPRTARYLGDVRVADFYSFAVLVLGTGMNVTAYSYDGEMKIGVLVAPEVHRQPELFVERLRSSLAELADRTADQPITARRS